MLFRELITAILLGSQWGDAEDFIGLWGLMSSFCLVLGTYCSGIYNAKGKTYISFIVQLLHLIVLVPVLIISGKYGFKAIYISRCLVRIQLVIIQMIFIKVFFKMSPIELIKRIIKPLLCSCIMIVMFFVLNKLGSSIVLQVCFAVLCGIAYLASMSLLFKGKISFALQCLGFDITRFNSFRKKK